MRIIEHDPEANLPYEWDWGWPDHQGRTWLDGDVIASAVVTINPSGPTVSTATTDGSKVLAWLSGATPGAYDLTCHITTTGGKQDERTMKVRVVNR